MSEAVNRSSNFFIRSRISEFWEETCEDTTLLNVDIVAGAVWSTAGGGGLLEVLGVLEPEFGSGDNSKREKFLVPVNTLKECAD